MLNGYEETEREILSTLRIDTNFLYSKDQMNSSNHNQANLNKDLPLNINNNCDKKNIYSNRFLINKPKNRFRSLSICIIAVKRIKYSINTLNN